MGILLRFIRALVVINPQAICYLLIETCKLNDANPQRWLIYALANIQSTKLSDLDKLLPLELC